MALGSAEAFAARLQGEPTSQDAVVVAVSQAGVEVDGRSGILNPEGFPEGWVVNVGDRVALEPTLTRGTGEICVFPRAHWSTRTLTAAEVTRGAALPSDPSLIVDPAAAIDGQAPGAGKAASIRLCIADRSAGPGPDRIICARW